MVFYQSLIISSFIFISMTEAFNYLDYFGSIETVSDTFSNNLSWVNYIFKHGIMNSCECATARSLNSRAFLWWPDYPSGGNEYNILLHNNNHVNDAWNHILECENFRMLVLQHICRYVHSNVLEGIHQSSPGRKKNARITFLNNPKNEYNTLPLNFFSSSLTRREWIFR